MPFNNNEYGPASPVPAGGTGSITAANITASGSVVAGGVVTNGLATNPSAPATPGVPAASTDLTSASLVDVGVYFLTGGTGVSVTLKNAAGTTIVSGVTIAAGSDLILPAGWKINLGAYSVAPTWIWLPV